MQETMKLIACCNECYRLATFVAGLRLRLFWTAMDFDFQSGRTVPRKFYSQVRVIARTCVVTTYKLEYDSHALTQRTATFNAHRTKRLQGQIILAQSELEHCEQELHKHCGGVRPYNLNFSRR